MDRQGHDYAASMPFSQQQQQSQQQQHPIIQQQYGFHPQAQQFPQQVHASPYLPPHPSLQQFPYHRHLPHQQQLYPQHHHPMILQQQQQPPSAFTSHVPPHHMSPSPLIYPFDSAPPPVAPPSDPELHKRIDKLVEYAVKNGPEFEAMIREKQQDNPAYSFLFGADGHGYYKYKLWLTSRASNPAFHPFPSSMPLMPSSHNPILSASSLSPPLSVTAGAPSSMLSSAQLQQPPFPPFYDQHQQQLPSQPFLGQARADYEPSTKTFKGLSGPLPSDVAAELNSVMNSLNGTKDSIKGAKMWFMQRSPFAPALAEALKDRIFALDDSERQLHIIFLANDILFDCLQRRMNQQDLDNEALAFKPVLGAMLAKAYSNPQNKDVNQSRLERILEFWAKNEVYDKETIVLFEKEMTGGVPVRPTARRDALSMTDSSTFTELQQTPPQAQQTALPGSLDRAEVEKHLPPTSSQYPSTQQFQVNQLPGAIYPPTAQATFQGSLPDTSAAQTAVQPSLPHLPPGAMAGIGEQTPPPYPLFPPGLIPGMVRKMQIGSGVPYSPMSPLDIPTVIPPSTVSQSEILERVSKFFKEIGEANPSEGPMKPADTSYEDEYERELPAHKGGACIPPPPSLQQQLDPETGTYPDGSVDRVPGFSSSGRLGLGASANPNEVSQYDDVYSSYRKQRSTSYHSSMSARASTR